MRSCGVVLVFLATAFGGVAFGAKPVVSAGQPVTHFKPAVYQQGDGRLRVEVWAAEGAVRGRATVRVDASTTGTPMLVDHQVALRVRKSGGRATGVGRFTLPAGVVPRGPVVVSHHWLRADGSAILNLAQPTERDQLGLSIGAMRTTYVRQERP